MKLLAQYFHEGLEKGELCVFASSESVDNVIDAFRQAGLFVADPLTRGALQIIAMNDTYLPHGKFVAHYMLHNVASFIEDARDQGFTGLRTAGEMEWISEHPEFQHAAAKYEADVTDLGKGEGQFIGMCMYPMSHDTTILQDALRTHPTLMYDGRLRMNPYVLEDMMDDPTALESRTAIEVFLANS